MTVFQPTEYIKNVNKVNYLKRAEQLDLMPIEKYKNLYKNKIISTKIKFDVNLFEKTMEKYSAYFKMWSDNRKDIMHLRFGLPLVNVTGNYDDDFDCTIGPLDYYNKNNPGSELWETDIITPTKILDEECFSVLDPIKPFLLRSSILKWYKNANFLPHYDTVVPSPWFRFWGTTNPSSIKLRFQYPESSNPNQGKYYECENAEAGRLYLIDTSIYHDAVCLGKMGYQFFISVNNDCYDTALKLRVENE
jgi:hypothetical protein